MKRIGRPGLDADMCGKVPLWVGLNWTVANESCLDYLLRAGTVWEIIAGYLTTQKLAVQFDDPAVAAELQLQTTRPPFHLLDEALVDTPNHTIIAYSRLLPDPAPLPSSNLLKLIIVAQ